MPLCIENPGQYRAALYARLSREDEGDGPSGSVTNQLSMLRGFAEENRLSIYDTYADDGWSGTSFDRPAFRRMIADIEAGKVNMVITKDLSRLGRDYITVGHYMERYFPEKGVRYISVLDGVDTGVESTSNDITPFRAIMNDMYAKDISKKIRSVKGDKQRKGLFIGPKPIFGYKIHPEHPNVLAVDEGAAPIVRRIFSMALEGVSCRKIAAVLNGENVPSPAVYAHLQTSCTGQWSGERISEMLRNETYIGNIVQGRRRRVSYKSKKCVSLPPRDWVIVQNTHEALVEPETFERVQALLSSRRHTRSRTYDFLLKGLVFCHECGHPLGVINRKNAAGEDVLYFICRTYQRSTIGRACTSHTIRESTLTRAVTEQVRSLCLSRADPRQLERIAREAIETRRSGSGDTAQKLRRRLNELQTKLDRAYLDRLNGVISEADFRRFYGMLLDRRRELSTGLERLECRPLSPADTQSQARRLVEQFITFACTSREVLSALIERVELTREKKVILRFRFRDLAAPTRADRLQKPMRDT